MDYYIDFLMAGYYDGLKGKNDMWTDRVKKHMEFTDNEMGDIQIVKDFLPSPENLIVKEDTVKITLSLTNRSVEFFKKQAKLHHTQYQKMIRALIDQYVSRCLSQEKKVGTRKVKIKKSCKVAAK